MNEKDINQNFEEYNLSGWNSAGNFSPKSFGPQADFRVSAPHIGSLMKLMMLMTMTMIMMMMMVTMTMVMMMMMLQIASRQMHLSGNLQLVNNLCRLSVTPDALFRDEEDLA